MSYDMDDLIRELIGIAGEPFEFFLPHLIPEWARKTLFEIADLPEWEE